MEAPKKIYIPRLEGGEVLVRDWGETRFRRYFNIDVSENVEYIRKDVFIEKACDFLNRRVYNCGEGSVIDDFKNFIEKNIR